jgi:hypothetical protein
MVDQASSSEAAAPVSAERVLCRQQRIKVCSDDYISVRGCLNQCPLAAEQPDGSESISSVRREPWQANADREPSRPVNGIMHPSTFADPTD